MKRLLSIALILSACNTKSADFLNLLQHTRSNAIINGEYPPSARVYDWYASIWYYGQFACGGSVVGPRHVLTAEHCIYPEHLAAISVHVGHEWYDVAAYWTASDGGDIGMLRVTDDLGVSSIAMNHDTQEPLPDTQLYVAGMGITETGELSDTIREAGAIVLSESDCGYYYAGIEERDMCAGIYGEGACNGDSGGPLWDAEARTLYGVVSRGRMPCATGGPTIFTRTSSYAGVIEALVRAQ